MPCLLAFGRSAINVPWMSEAIFLSPEGPGNYEAELQINALLQVGEPGGRISFFHRGEIYAIRARNEAWVQGLSDRSDWFFSQVMDKRDIGPHRQVQVSNDGQEYKIEFSDLVLKARAAEDACHVVGRAVMCPDRSYAWQSSPPEWTDVAEPTAIGNTDANIEDALFSAFTIECPHQGSFIVRLSFRTKHGISPVPPNMTVNIQGPKAAFVEVKNEIARDRNIGEDRRALLTDHLLKMFELQKPAEYEVQLIPHPSYWVTVETEQCPPSVSRVFTVESTADGIPIAAAACPSRAIFYDLASRPDFAVRVNAVRQGASVLLSQEYDELLRDYAESLPVGDGGEVVHT